MLGKIKNAAFWLMLGLTSLNAYAQKEVNDRPLSLEKRRSSEEQSVDSARMESRLLELAGGPTPEIAEIEKVFSIKLQPESTNSNSPEILTYSGTAPSPPFAAENQARKRNIFFQIFKGGRTFLSFHFYQNPIESDESRQLSCINYLNFVERLSESWGRKKSEADAMDLSSQSFVGFHSNSWRRIVVAAKNPNALSCVQTLTMTYKIEDNEK